MKFSKITIFVYIAFSALLTLNSVQARVKVSPMVIMTETKQGQAKGVITLSNEGAEKVRFRLYSSPFTYNKKGLKVSESQENDLSPYLIFSPRELVIPPRQRRRVRLLARMLPSMAEREYRAVIFTEQVKKKSTEGLSINSRIGVAVYVRHGNLSFDLSAKGATYDPDERKIVLMIKNRGKATVRPKIRWRLIQRGKEVKTGQYSAFTILAESIRHIPIRFFKEGDKPITGQVRLKGELVWGKFDAPQTLPFDFPLSIPVSP